jgi:hypothetical protein
MNDVFNYHNKGSPILPIHIKLESQTNMEWTKIMVRKLVFQKLSGVFEASTFKHVLEIGNWDNIQWFWEWGEIINSNFRKCIILVFIFLCGN